MSSPKNNFLWLMGKNRFFSESIYLVDSRLSASHWVFSPWLLHGDPCFPLWLSVLEAKMWLDPG